MNRGLALVGSSLRSAREAAREFKDINDNKDIKDARKREGFTLVVHA